MTVMIMQLGQVFVTGEEPAHRDVFDVGVIFDLILDQILPLFPFPLCGTLQVQQRLIQGCIPTTGNIWLPQLSKYRQYEQLQVQKEQRLCRPFTHSREQTVLLTILSILGVLS